MKATDEAERAVEVSPAGTVRGVVSTSGYPSKSTVQGGTLHTTDDEGNVSVSGVTTLSRGETAYVGILAYENADGSGAESSLAQDQATFHKDESAQFNWIELQKVEDDGTDDTYFVDWSTNAPVTSGVDGWRITVTCFRNDVSTERVTFVPGDEPVQITASGDGDGAKDTHRATFELTRDLPGSLVGAQLHDRQESGEIESSDVSGSAPANLSATFDGAACEMDLSWDADPNNQQSVYRCTGGSCDPTVDGSAITTLSAGTSSFSDDMTGISQGTTLSYEVQSTAGTSNIASGFRGKC